MTEYKWNVEGREVEVDVNIGKGCSFLVKDEEGNVDHEVRYSDGKATAVRGDQYLVKRLIEAGIDNIENEAERKYVESALEAIGEKDYEYEVRKGEVIDRFLKRHRY